MATIDDTLDTLFGAAERGDWDTFAACCADDVVIAQNVGQPMTLAEALVALPALTADGTSLKYENVRRFVGDRHATELHDAVFTKPDGRVVTLDICIVVQFNDDGKIVRADEYLDSAAAAALFT